MFEVLWEKLHRIAKEWRRMTDYRNLEALDGVGSFRKNEVARLPRFSRYDCISPSGRFVFDLKIHTTHFSDDDYPEVIPSDLSVCVISVIDLFLSEKYSLEVCNLWHMQDSFIVAAYSINDSMLALLDQNGEDDTLRQRIFLLDHRMRSAVCLFHRSFRFVEASNSQIGSKYVVVKNYVDEFLLFSKDPADYQSQLEYPPVHITSVIHQRFVEDNMPGRTISENMFFSVHDGYLCYWVFSEGEVAVSDDGRKTFFACISLRVPEFCIKNAEICSKTGFPLAIPLMVYNYPTPTQNGNTNLMSFVHCFVNSGAPQFLLLKVVSSLASILGRFSSFVFLLKYCIRPLPFINSGSLAAVFSRMPLYLLLSAARSRMHDVIDTFVSFRIPFRWMWEDLWWGILPSYEVLADGDASRHKMATLGWVLDTMHWRRNRIDPRENYQMLYLTGTSNQLIAYELGIRDYGHWGLRFAKLSSSVHVGQSPCGKCCSLADLAMMSIQRFPNEQLKHVGRKLVRRLYDQ